MDTGSIPVASTILQFAFVGISLSLNIFYIFRSLIARHHWIIGSSAKNSVLSNTSLAQYIRLHQAKSIRIGQPKSLKVTFCNLLQPFATFCNLSIVPVLHEDATASEPPLDLQTIEAHLLSLLLQYQSPSKKW